MDHGPNGARDRICRFTPPMAEILVTYMEQRHRPKRLRPIPPDDPVHIIKLDRIPIHFYRYLYRHVGDAWGWRDRNGWSDLQLDARLRDPNVEVYVLYVGGVPAGYGELDRTRPSECELRLFGLMPEFLGRGWGPFFLGEILDHAWSGETARVYLSTCSLDHPSALTMYLRFGFTIYHHETAPQRETASTAE